MKKLLLFTLLLGLGLNSQAQVNFCPGSDFNWKTRIMASPDRNLPILNIEKMFKPDRTFGGAFIKSIKVPEFIRGMLAADDKLFLGYSDNNLYRINIETEDIQSFPHNREGVLPSGEEYEWEFENTTEGELYLYKYSDSEELPMNLFIVNFDTQTLDLAWETGLTISSSKSIDKIPTTDYWTYADDKGNAVILDLETKTKIMEHQFSVPVELTDREGARLSVRLGASYQGAINKQCNQVNYSVSDYQTNKSYFAQYDLSTKQTTVSQLAKGHVIEITSDGKRYWHVTLRNEQSTAITIFNDDDFTDVRFQFNGLEKGGVPLNMKYSEDGIMQTLAVTYTSGKIETYDWATKKLLKTEEAAIEIKDF